PPRTARSRSATELPRIRARAAGREDQRDGVLEPALDVREEAGPARAVDGPVVARERRAHRVTDRERALAHDRPRLDRPDREDARLRRVDDRGEALDAEHPEVRDAEGGAREVVARERAALRALAEVARPRRDLEQRQSI